MRESTQVHETSEGHSGQRGSQKLPARREGDRKEKTRRRIRVPLKINAALASRVEQSSRGASIQDPFLTVPGPEDGFQTPEKKLIKTLLY